MQVVQGENVTEHKKAAAEEELEKHRNHLEELVKKRTGALEKANEQLRQEIEYRKQLEESLKEEQFKLREYFENLPLLAYIITFDEKIADCNNLAVRTLGYDSKEELIGKPLISTVYAPTSQEKAKQLFEKWKKEKKIKNEELQVITKQGKILDILLNVDTIFDSNGKPIHSLSTHLDVTEKKQAQDKLRASEKRYRDLVENLQEGIWMIDEDACTTFVNPPMAEMLGYTVNEMQGKPLFDFMDGEAVGIAKEKLSRRKAGIKEQHEFEFIRKDGTRLITLMETRPFTDKTGNYIGAIAGVLDITERKRVEDAFRESEERYRLLFENMLDGFAYCEMIFDDQEHPVDFVYLAVNRAFEQLTGLENVVGKKVTEVIPGIKESSRELLEIYGQVALTGKPERFEIDFKPLERWLSISVYSTRKGYFVAVFDNITERKRAEEAMRTSQERLFQSQKMETLGTLVAGVAHEINNPINLILFNVPLLQKVWRDIQPILEKHALHEPHKKYGGLTSEFLKQDLDRLIRDMDLAANRVARIVRGLKDFAKMSDIRDKMPIQINEAVTNAMRLAQTTLKKAGIDVELKLGQDLPLIEGNIQGLEQIVLNLIVNASQAIEHESGRIRVKTGFDKSRQQIVVVVSDNGKGIDPSICDRIFDPFFTSRQTDGGTGLGLAVSYSITKAHDGEITFESEVGRGTTFTVTLPVTRRGKRVRILVADDDERVRKMIVYTLTRYQPYVVEEASTGSEALLKIGTFSPDLVILDVFMPDTDGLEVCRALKKDPRLSGIKVIIITGYAADPKLEQIKRLGFEQILEKPLRMGDLLREADKILGEGAGNGEQEKAGWQ